MCTFTGHGIEWGGATGDKLWVNIFEWFWAIAPGGSPADVNGPDLAASLGVSEAEAARIIALADFHFRSEARCNQRSGATQRYALRTKRELVAEAKGLGLKVSGFDLKDEVIRILVDHTLPAPRLPCGSAF